jgi:chorismate-pyruvate lyase
MTPLARRISNLLSPLDDLYESSGEALPSVEPLEGPQVPEPYRTLLVHGRDMTTTLERRCGRPLHLRVLLKHLTDQELIRQVVLESDEGNTPWEFGAIRIQLAPFDETSRQKVLECHRPLGAILIEHGLEHSCRPTGFFRLTTDRISSHAFGINGAQLLYGRHTFLYGANEALLAEVVEILPPLEDRPMDLK